VQWVNALFRVRIPSQESRQRGEGGGPAAPRQIAAPSPHRRHAQPVPPQIPAKPQNLTTTTTNLLPSGHLTSTNLLPTGHLTSTNLLPTGHLTSTNLLPTGHLTSTNLLPSGHLTTTNLLPIAHAGGRARPPRETSPDTSIAREARRGALGALAALATLPGPLFLCPHNYPPTVKSPWPPMTTTNLLPASLPRCSHPRERFLQSNQALLVTIPGIHR
jgi:hypothetical protein